MEMKKYLAKIGLYLETRFLGRQGRPKSRPLKKKKGQSGNQKQNATFLNAKKYKNVAPCFLVHFSKKNTSQKSWKKNFFQNEKKIFFCLKIIFKPFFSDFEQKKFFSIFPAFFIGAHITRCLGRFCQKKLHFGPILGKKYVSKIVKKNFFPKRKKKFLLLKNHF